MLKSNFIIGEKILLENLKSVAAEYEKIVVVTDTVVDKLFLQEEGFLEFEKIVLKGGEQLKCFQELESLIDRLSELKVRRNDLIVIVGGGVLGDLVGFAASIYLRGIDYWQVPTTLVAMVDSSLGGKTGINTKFGKNLVGGFQEPTRIVADLWFLKSLPESEMLNGLAESYKHALIKDLGLIEILKADPTGLKGVLRSATVKLEIVDGDPREKHARKFLNVGHTVGHAIERLEDFAVPHGKAVAIGIKVEAYLSWRLGVASREVYEQILQGLADLNLDFDYQLHEIDRLAEFMMNDKKCVSDKISLAIVVVPGERCEMIEVGVEKVVELLNEYAQNN